MQKLGDHLAVRKLQLSVAAQIDRAASLKGPHRYWRPGTFADVPDSRSVAFVSCEYESKKMLSRSKRSWKPLDKRVM
jgi:hypothetical protein